MLINKWVSVSIFRIIFCFVVLRLVTLLTKDLIHRALLLRNIFPLHSPALISNHYDRFTCSQALLDVYNQATAAVAQVQATIAAFARTVRVHVPWSRWNGR